MFIKKRKEYKKLKSIRMELDSYIRINSKIYYEKIKDITLLNFIQKNRNGDFWINNKIENEKYYIQLLSCRFTNEFYEFYDIYKRKVKRLERVNKLNSLIKD